MKYLIVELENGRYAKDFIYVRVVTGTSQGVGQMHKAAQL